MRYSKSMIEAVQQVGLYEMMDYAIIDGDNKIIGLYKGNMAKKQAQMNMKGAERQVGIKKPLKVIPVSKKKKGDTVIAYEDESPVDTILGVEIFPVIHVTSQEKIYVSLEDIKDDS